MGRWLIAVANISGILEAETKSGIRINYVGSFLISYALYAPVERTCNFSNYGLYLKFAAPRGCASTVWTIDANVPGFVLYSADDSALLDYCEIRGTRNGWKDFCPLFHWIIIVLLSHGLLTRVSSLFSSSCSGVWG